MSRFYRRFTSPRASSALPPRSSSCQLRVGRNFSMLKKLRTTVVGGLALVLGVLALTAGAALADGTAPANTATTGTTGSRTFNCDAAKTRLANVEARIAKIQARIA